MSDSNSEASRLIMVRTCGHDRDVTGLSLDQLPKVGTQVSCWSACDHGTHRSSDQRPRFVARYEDRAVAVETQAEFDARMARGRLERAARSAPERDPFKRLPVLDDEPF